MTLEELRNTVCRYIDENRDAYNETGDECYRAVKEELLHILGLIDTVDHEPVGNPCKMNLDNVIRTLESEEAVCRSHSDDDYYRGMADGYKLSVDALHGLSGNPEQLTLRELARELRNVFKFKYLTVSPDICGVPMEIYCWTSIRPTYNAKGRMWIISQEGSQTIMSSFDAWNLEKSLDLSEYKDEDGNVDYEKCIVEVE